MYIVHVQVQVKEGFANDFKKASQRNAACSLLEAGVVRFDVIQEIDAPEQFVLVEVYKNEHDAVKHKETAHYKEWRDVVAPMMAKPRTGLKYTNIFPEDIGW